MTSTWLPKIRLRMLTGILVSLLAMHTLSAHAHTCAERLNPKDVSFEELHGTYIKANGVAVTGDFLYPLDFVLKNLDLKPEEVRTLLAGKKVLSLAEGMSGFLPFLLQNGIDARGVDLWYHTGHFPMNFGGMMMQEYMQQYGQQLLQGDARDIPAASNSVDMIFSHMLVNNLTNQPDIQRDIIKDVIRVLKPGAEARIYGFGDSSTPVMQKYLLEKFKGKVTFEFKSITATAGSGPDSFTDTGDLLILRKLEP